MTRFWVVLRPLAPKLTSGRRVRRRTLFTTYAYYNSDKFHFYGEPLMQHCMAFRSLLDAGIHAAAGSDFPPGPFDPRMAIHGMVTRTGWNGETWGANQRINVAEALSVNTINGAYNEEAVKGSISLGKYADFVMVSDDIFKVDESKIKDVQIVRTIVGGKTVYQAGRIDVNANIVFDKRQTRTAVREPQLRTPSRRTKRQVNHFECNGDVSPASESLS